MKTRVLNLMAGAFIFLLAAAPSISFDAKVPGWLDLPSHIRSIAIIDRSERNKKMVNVIEGGITGERIGQDNVAAKMFLKGLFDQLDNSGKYEIVRTNVQMKFSGGVLEFAPPLDWDSVEEICRKYNSEALISLEFFDTDHVGNILRAKAGVRIYDPRTRNIRDEYAFNQEISTDQNNPEFIDLLANYPHQDIIKNLSYEAGTAYGRRIAPYWARVNRIYYNRPKRFKNLAQGARMMEVNDWDSAISALERATSSKKRKVQGRAAHNLAVVYEILGDYPMAKEWAQKAWGIYGNKDSKEYTYVLNQRIFEIEKLQRQFEE